MPGLIAFFPLEIGIQPAKMVTSPFCCWANPYYHSVIKHSNGKSHRNGSFDWKTVYKYRIFMDFPLRLTTVGCIFLERWCGIDVCFDLFFQHDGNHWAVATFCPGAWWLKCWCFFPLWRSFWPTTHAEPDIFAPGVATNTDIKWHRCRLRRLRLKRNCSQQLHIQKPAHLSLETTTAPSETETVRLFLRTGFARRGVLGPPHAMSHFVKKQWMHRWFCHP